MKKIFILIICGFFAASAYSQSLRVSFNGNRDFQLVVDGKTYHSASYLNDEVVLNNLPGQHNIIVYRINKRGKAKEVYSSAINLSPGEEVHLAVNNNGSIERTETSSNAAYGYRTPMTDVSFNEVVRRVNNQWGQTNKMSTARDVFNTESYYFSTDQVIRILELINSEANRLELAKLAYDNVTDPANYDQVRDLLRSQASRNELDNYVRNYDYNDSYNSYKVAMSESGFNQLYQSIRNQKNTSSRLSAATRAFNSATNYFTVPQAHEIISLFTGDNNRLQLAKLVMDNLVNMEKIGILYDLLTSQSAKEQLDYYIRSNGYADSNYDYTINTAMTDAQFTALYDDIRRRWLPFTKYNAAIDAFSSTTNYFTTAQVKQIIALLSSESNRLDLAKLAYDNIVDKHNFSSLYDLLTTQESRDALDDFVRNNSGSQY